MRIIFAGTPEAAVPSLESLAAVHEVVGVLTRPDARSGRGRRLIASPVRKAAERMGIPVIAASDLRDEQTQAQIAKLNADIAAVVAYGAIIPRELLRTPTHGWVNLHFSLLPAWRGAAPVQHALIAGDQVTGASTFIIEEGLDTGPVLGTLTVEVQTADTGGKLLEKLSREGAELLRQSLEGLVSGKIVPQTQNHAEATLAPKITRDDGRIVWSHPSFAVERRVRALQPTPGTWTMYQGKRLNIHEVASAIAPELPNSLSPGEIYVRKHAVYVGTASTPLLLITLQPAGKKPMPAADWARGLQKSQGVVFDE